MPFNDEHSRRRKQIWDLQHVERDFIEENKLREQNGWGKREPNPREKRAIGELEKHREGLKKQREGQR